MGYVTVRRFGSGGSGATRYLVVALGDRECGLDLDAVREIRAVAEIVPVPSAPAHVRGTVDVRGEAVEVVDLASLLGVGEWVRRPESSLIILRHGRLRVGLLVDRALEIAEVPAHRLDPAAPVDVDSRFVAAAAERLEGTLVILDVPRLVSAAGGEDGEGGEGGEGSGPSA